MTIPVSLVEWLDGGTKIVGIIVRDVDGLKLVAPDYSGGLGTRHVDTLSGMLAEISAPPPQDGDDQNVLMF